MSFYLWGSPQLSEIFPSFFTASRPEVKPITVPGIRLQDLSTLTRESSLEYRPLVLPFIQNGVLQKRPASFRLQSHSFLICPLHSVEYLIFIFRKNCSPALPPPDGGFEPLFRTRVLVPSVRILLSPPKKQHGFSPSPPCDPSQDVCTTLFSPFSLAGMIKSPLPPCFLSVLSSV